MKDREEKEGGTVRQRARIRAFEQTRLINLVCVVFLF
jgi:hypothetical protein